MINKISKNSFSAIALIVGVLFANIVNASLLSALSGQVVNDTDRNITWLANANLADTQDFGVSGILANGNMTWDTAKLWIAAMNSANYLGYSDWRLPTVIDTGTPGCNFAFGGTDCGSNVNTAASEMAHLYYDELGNKAFYDTSGIGPQSGWGLTNTGPFSNLQSSYYWSGTEYTPTNEAWRFLMVNGDQFLSFKTFGLYAIPVRTGLVEVVSVPEPVTLALFGMGLAGLGWARRR